MKTRDYQDFAVYSIFRYFEEGKTGHPIVAMPTATGKSHVIASFVQKVLHAYPGQRILMLTHVKELIEQNFDKLKKTWPNAPAGIYSAGLGRRDLYLPIIYAGIASAKSVAAELGHIDLVLVDECHLVSDKENTMYRILLDTLMRINPKLKVIGFTATPYRMSSGSLIENGIFTDICVDMTGLEAFNWFITQGYLSKVIPKATNTEIDVSKVGTVGGDYNIKQLSIVTDQESITRAACLEMIELGANRNHWLIFALSIHHAESISRILEELGISSVVVHSKLSPQQRNENTERFTSGGVRALVNMGVFTTGFDYPLIDLITVLRATKSTSLWVQMIGRGLRVVYAAGYDLLTKEGRLEAIYNGPKQDCLVLDFAGNTKRLGPINDPVMPKRGKKMGGGTAPVKVCPTCMCYNPISTKTCEFCGYEFPVHIKIEKQASAIKLLADTKVAEVPEVNDFMVSHICYAAHSKIGRPVSLKVTYTCGLRNFEEWVCFEHEGFPRRKAHDWWKKHGGIKPPLTVEEALQRLSELKEANQIKVWTNKQYPEIMNYGFE